MKELLNNKRVKLGFSLFNILYAVLVIGFAYSTFLYELIITSVIGFAVVYILVNLVFLATMFLSRDQLATAIISMILLPVIFIILILNFGNWILFIPPFIVSVIMFFASKVHETLKTILGTFYLLLYILGIIAFLLIKTLFGSSNIETRLSLDIQKDDPIWQVYTEQVVSQVNTNTISPDGKYRFYILDIKDSSKGRVEIYVVPNDKDKEYGLYSFRDRGRERRVALTTSRGDKAVPKVQWTAPDKIQYQFPNEEVKETQVAPQKKDYFAFIY